MTRSGPCIDAFLLTSIWRYPGLFKDDFQIWTNSGTLRQHGIQYLNKFESTQTFSLKHCNYPCDNVAYLHKNTGVKEMSDVKICLDNGFLSKLKHDKDLLV